MTVWTSLIVAVVSSWTVTAFARDGESEKGVPPQMNALEPSFVPSAGMVQTDLHVATSAIAQTENAWKKADICKLSFPPPAEMTRADLYTARMTDDPVGVLVLCPGFNSNGEGLICQPAWQEFARANRLDLCAISFASPDQAALSSRGYYHAAGGSGDLLLGTIRRRFGRDLPILIYGFSGGAHFTASFVNWRPGRVLGWCAYSAGWWEDPQKSDLAPPGIVACGEQDARRYGASLTFFAQARASGQPVTWVSLGETGHVWSDPLDNFVRAYFSVALRNFSTADESALHSVNSTANQKGEWRDVDTKEVISPAQAAAQPTLACWLPDKSLGALWKTLDQP